MAREWEKQSDWEMTPAPFSFVYGKTPSSEILKRCRRSGSQQQLDGQRTAHSVIYVDPETGLQVRWEAVEYPVYKTVEWTVYLKNTGTETTPIIGNFQGLDCRLSRHQASDEFKLHYNRGDTCAPDSYEPMVKQLGPGDEFRSAPENGRPTNGCVSLLQSTSGSRGSDRCCRLAWPMVSQLCPR